MQKQLTYLEARVYRMRFAQKLRPIEIASELSITPASVKSALLRARAKVSADIPEPVERKIACNACTGISTCRKCYGVRCAVCVFTIYRDESWARDANGKMRHVRCALGPKPRPSYMVDPEDVLALPQESI